MQTQWVLLFYVNVLYKNINVCNNLKHSHPCIAYIFAATLNFTYYPLLFYITTCVNAISISFIMFSSMITAPNIFLVTSTYSALCCLCMCKMCLNVNYACGNTIF